MVSGVNSPNCAAAKKLQLAKIFTNLILLGESTFAPKPFNFKLNMH